MHALRATVEFERPEMTAEEAIYIEAPPDRVYAALADVTRMGEFSPECYRCVWIDSARSEVGSRFRGYNRSGLMRWSRLVEILEADPGRSFAFQTVPDRMHQGATLWRFQLEPEGEGTRVVQSSTVLAQPNAMTRAIMRLVGGGADPSPGMRTTLARLKASLESETPGRRRDG